MIGPSSSGLSNHKGTGSLSESDCCNIDGTHCNMLEKVLHIILMKSDVTFLLVILHHATDQ